MGAEMLARRVWKHGGLVIDRGANICSSFLAYVPSRVLLYALPLVSHVARDNRGIQERTFAVFRGGSCRHGVARFVMIDGGLRRGSFFSADLREGACPVIGNRSKALLLLV